MSSDQTRGMGVSPMHSPLKRHAHGRDDHATRMPTISLYTPPAHPDAWHQIRAPGGYEWWHFDAEDARHDRRLVAALFDGDAMDPRYVREYARYRRNPT